MSWTSSVSELLPAFIGVLQEAIDKNITLQDFVKKTGQFTKEALEEAGFSLEEMVKMQTSSIMMQAKIARGALQELGLVLGDLGGFRGLGENIEGFTDFVNKLSGAIERNSDVAKIMIKTIFGLAAIGPINFLFIRAIMSFGLFLRSMMTFTTRMPIFAALGFLSRALYVVISTSDDVQARFKELVIQGGSLGAALRGFLSALGNALGIGGSFTDWLEKKMVSGIQKATDVLLFLTIFFDRLTSKLKPTVSLLQPLADSFKKIGGGG